MDWTPSPKPASMAETRLLEAILSEHFPINSNLPGERELAEKIGVTRPTLREAKQRLARDGWLDIQHGKATRVRNYLQEGSLAVLTVLAQAPAYQPPDFIVHLLEFRVLIAPEYTRQALEKDPEAIARVLDSYQTLEDSASAYAQADWDLHVLLARQATNPVYGLLLNGFKGLYLLIGAHYFAEAKYRRHSEAFYKSLLTCVRQGEAGLVEAEALTRRVMMDSLDFAKKMKAGEL